MKSSLKVKLLQHLAAKKSDNAGFTLIELLVVIIIIGILSAIALPSFLNQANKAKQSEAKTYIGSLNRGQQAYYLENGEFIKGDETVRSAANENAISLLGIGVKESSSNYGYTMTATDVKVGVTSQAQPITVDPATNAFALNTQAAVKAYRGGVAIETTIATGEATTVAILCEAKAAQVAGGADGKGEIVYASISNAPATACEADYKSLD